MDFIGGSLGVERDFRVADWMPRERSTEWGEVGKRLQGKVLMKVYALPA